MKITIDVEDKGLLLSALSHAINAYGEIVGSVFFACDIPLAFEKYLEKNNLTNPDDQYNHLMERFNLLKDVFHQMERAEENED